MSYPVGPFRRQPAGGSPPLPPFFPLTLSPGPVIYIDSRLGYDAIAGGGNVDTLDNRGSDAHDLPAATVPRATMLRTGTPSGAPLIRFPAPAGCPATSPLYSTSADFVWPVTGVPTTDYTWYSWIRTRTENHCEAAGGCLFGGSPTRPRFRLWADEFGLPNVCLLVAIGPEAGAQGARITAEDAGVGQGIHTITIRCTQVGGAMGRTQQIFVDGAAGTLVVNASGWNPVLSNMYQIGAEDSTTPALAGPRGCHSDLGCHVFFHAAHTEGTRLRMERWMRLQFGSPI